jgi:hypothetical protein
MQTGGPRAEVDARLRAWEEELEMLRVRLGSGPEALHQKYRETFAELYRRKETLRACWEAVRGVYRPAPDATRRYQEALAAMEQAWVGAEPMVAEILGSRPRT